VYNIIFGALQRNPAHILHLNPALILSLQLCGASLGNAICLFNIIAPCAVAGVEDFGGVLIKNLIPVLIASFVCSMIAFGWILMLI